MTTPILLERWTRVAPLGLRFWDSATGQFITDDLSVQAVPKLVSGVFSGQPAIAFPNRSGVFVFNHLPGLREAEFGAGDADYWSSPPAQKDYILTLDDPLGRFNPFIVTVKAPTQKILVFACANGKPTPAIPTQPTGSIPLFSSPGSTRSGDAEKISQTLPSSCFRDLCV